MSRRKPRPNADQPLDHDWRAKANCRHMFDTGRGNIDPFFPDAREDGLRIPIQVLRESLKYTRQLCAECPVKRECFEFAIQFDEHYGIWGGVCFERRFHDKTRMRIA